MFNTEGMISNNEAVDLLPIGPPLYHPDFFTDRTDRFCASELIRETLFETLGKELPYCCEVRVETFDESKRYLDEDSVGSGKNKSMIRIGATILVERDSQKGIVVGKGGQQIKDLGMNARKKLQVFFDTKVSWQYVGEFMVSRSIRSHHHSLSDLAS
jgi:GTP-binding protein Era